MYISVSLTREKVNKNLTETIFITSVFVSLFENIAISVSLYLFTFNCIPIPHISVVTCTSLFYLPLSTPIHMKYRTNFQEARACIHRD